jgi:hypothetical protein
MMVSMCSKRPGARSEPKASVVRLERFSVATLHSFLLVLGLVGACSLPRSFRVVSLQEALAVISGGQATVLEVLADDEAPSRSPAQGGLYWRPGPGAPGPAPSIPPGAVLVVASSGPVAYRSAAALVRAGNPDVIVVITANAEERQTLYALRAKEEGPIRGRDS